VKPPGNSTVAPLVLSGEHRRLSGAVETSLVLLKLRPLRVRAANGDWVGMGTMTRESMIRSRGRAAVARLLCSAAVVGTGAVLVAGCSSTSSVSTKPTSPSTSKSSGSTSNGSASGSVMGVPCKNVNSLRTSLTSLSHTKISPSSSAQLTSDLKNVKSQLTTLKGKATGSLKTQLDGVNDSVNNITKASKQLNTSPVTAVRSLTTNLVALKAKAGPVIDELKTACPTGKS
jgi:phage-related minor tail protein